MRVSVVINTYNRAASLEQALRGLRYQTHDAFEVVVVNGPSTDRTEEVLAKFAGAVRVGTCPEVHLSKSRNLGVGMAAGEVVAFIDDDAVPEPTWLEQLAAAYDSDRVGGAGGVVYDHTGFTLQYRHGVSTRLGEEAPLEGPATAYARPGADPFLGLMGTNSSFRRSCLVEIGGFDEEIEYFLDETEVCMQVLDRGYGIRALPDAAVHHKYLASHLRSAQKVVLDPYPSAKNRCYFALRHGRKARPARAVERVLNTLASDLRGYCETHFAAGRIDARQRQFFLERLEQGLRDGDKRGREGARRGRDIPPPDPRHFLPFPTMRPAGGRLKIALVAGAAAPRERTGDSAFAAALAALGHEVHVIARSPDINRVDFEDGVWVHRLARPQRHIPDVQEADCAGALFGAAAVYQEVRRIQGSGPLDIVSSPFRGCAGMLCALDLEGFPTVLTLPAAALLGEAAGTRGGAEPRGPTAALERVMARRAVHLYPASGPVPQETRGGPEAREKGAGQDLTHMAAEAAGFYRRVAAQHARGRASSPRAGAGAVTARLTKVLGEALGMPERAARRATLGLLDPLCYPVDYLGGVRALWSAPDADFVSGLYRVLLNREPDAEMATHLARLRRGVPRALVVRNMAQSEEARRRGLPVAWLKCLPAPWHRYAPHKVWGLVTRMARMVLGLTGRPASAGAR